MIDINQISINDPAPLSDAYGDFKNLRDHSGTSIISDMNFGKELRTNIVKNISSTYSFFINE